LKTWLALAALAALAPAWAADAPAPVRVEARSGGLMAVGVVHDDSMSIHVSRIADNAPVRDAVITVVLRGTPHPTRAETDGSYSLQTPDLKLPGAAAVDFQISEGSSHQSLQGTLDVGGAGRATDDRNANRQLWWWVLNFSVCGAAVWLFSRRRKAAKT
jgi:hypothetical protein